jgi:hypothetical protein
LEIQLITRFCDAYAAKLRSLPGVRDASITTVYPPSENWRVMFSIPGKPVTRLEDVPSTLNVARTVNPVLRIKQSLARDTRKRYLLLADARRC